MKIDSVNLIQFSLDWEYEWMYNISLLGIGYNYEDKEKGKLYHKRYLLSIRDSIFGGSCIDIFFRQFDTSKILRRKE